MSLIYYTGLIITGLFFVLESRYKSALSESGAIAKKKYIGVDIVLAFGIIILLSANRTGYDSISYQRFFSAINFENNNILDYSYVFFGYLIATIKKFIPNISYFEFQALVCLVMGYIAKKALDSYVLSFRGVCFLYLASGTIAMDGLQFKNFISVLFLLIGYSYVVKENRNVFCTCMYTLFIGIAVLFHFSFAIYLFLILFIWLDGKRADKISKVLLAVGVCSFMVLYFIPALLPGILNLIAKIPIFKKLLIYTLSFNGRRALPALFIYLFQIFFLQICKKESVKYKGKLKKITAITWYVNLAMGILLPSLLYANAAFRLFRNLYIINFIVFSNYIIQLPRLSKKRNIMSFIAVIVSIAVMIYPNFLLNQRIDIMEAMLKGKFFWLR